MSVSLAAVASLDTRRLESPVYRSIVAVDIEGSATRTHAEKGEIRRRMYGLLEQALGASGISSRHREQFADRGNGVLILVRPHDDVPKTLLLGRLIPMLTELLTEHNAATRPELRLRLRAAVHAGEIHWDSHGFFGEDLDIAFRLLDAPRVKKTLRETTESPLTLVVSQEIFDGIVRQGHLDEAPYQPLVRVRVGRRQVRGWIRAPAPVNPAQPVGRRLVRTDRPAAPVTTAAPSRALTLPGVYRTLEKRLAETEDPHDVEAGLARLREWMPAGEAGYRGPTACAAAGITYNQLDYWARTGLVEPSVRAARGPGSHRLYSFRDILVLKVIKRLLDTGISLQQVRAAVQHLRDRGGADLAEVTLMSDGVSVYECTSADEVVGLLQDGQGVFGIALGRVWREVEGDLALLPALRAEHPLPRHSDLRRGLASASA